MFFSFEDVNITEFPLTAAINPIKGGTPNIFLKKFEWITPPNRTARLELALERRYKPTGTNEIVIETSTIMFNDPTHLATGGEKRQSINLEQYARIILVYRPDLTMDSLKNMIGKVATWQELTLKTFQLLPADFAAKESTWKLIYYRGQGPITVDTKYIVKLGTYDFPWNDTYDHLVESEESRSNRRQNSAVNSSTQVEEAAIVSQQNQPQYISDEDLFS